MNKEKTYTFVGQEEFYRQYRPRWNTDFAEKALATAGIFFEGGIGGRWTGTAYNNRPVVALLGTGAGSDALVFKELGCHVVVVDPNLEFLNIAKNRLSKIRHGITEFIYSDAMNVDIGSGSVDLIVAAQSAHTMRETFSLFYMTPEQKASGMSVEEITRRHWLDLLVDNDKPRVSFWYYNLDPRISKTRELHEILVSHCTEYRNSGTQLFNAQFFEPDHFQAWMDAEHITTSELMHVDTLHLEPEEIGSWLRSYSFAPKDKDLRGIVEILLKKWFAKYQPYGNIKIPYLGYILQAPLRTQPVSPGMSYFQCVSYRSSPLRANLGRRAVQERA